MVKAYLRYELSQAWGVITSNSNICYDHSGTYLVASSLENVSIWNIKQGLVVRSLQSNSTLYHSPNPHTLHSSANYPPPHPMQRQVRTLIPPPSQSDRPPGEVTHLAPSPISSQIAVGHSDGTIRLWDILTGTCQSTFAGHHRSAVTALRFEPTGAFLVSGSKDTDLILWDIAAETGLVKLRGHRGQITDALFLTLPSSYTTNTTNTNTTTNNGDDQQGNGNFVTATTIAAKHLVSCAKDGLVKVWDLDTQHCIQTIMVGTGEAWSLDVNSSHTRVAVGSNDAELRLYSIAPSSSSLGSNSDSDNDSKRDQVLVAMGSIRRTAAERAATVRFHDNGGGVTLLTCQGAGKVTEVWKVRSEGEAGKKAKRRKKRRREKKGGQDKDEEDDGGDDKEEEDAVVATDELEAVSVIRSKHKVRSFAYAPSTNTQSSLIAGTKRNLRSNSAIAAHGASSSSTQARLILSLTNNSLEIWDIKEGEASPEKSQVLDTAGHRSDIRALALSSDDSLCASASSSGIKLWNAHTGVCLRSVESGYGLTVVFAPGNKHVVVGTKEGSLEIINLNSGEKKVIADAHGGAVWSLALLPDGSGLVSGSADHSVKFWEWQLLSNKVGKMSSVAGTAGAGLNGTTTELSLKNTKTLKMNDDVLCVRVSPDNKLLAVALLDSTVRIFFVDSLKFYLAMYGHKLPVLSMDISSDGTLLATGSADKNLRIWGLDFGDCHRSLFAHNDSVMCVAFVPKTHYLFTAGKDKTVRYWDADKYEELLTLEGHHGEVWSLVVSSFGDFVVSGSHDRSLRRWERTEEPFFLEEEKEKRLDSLFEADLEGQEGRGALSLGGGGRNDDDEGEDGGKGAGEGVAAGRKTLETVSAADAIVEALELAVHEEERVRAAAQEAAANNTNNLTPNPMLLGRTPSQHVLSVVAGIRASDLEQALLLLPFNDALTILDYLVEWLEQGSQVELLCRISTLLLRVHMQQLIGTPTARPVLIKLKELLRSRVQYMKDMVGFNVAAMTHLQRVVKMRSFAAGGGGDGEDGEEGEEGGPVGAAAVAVKKFKRKMEQSTAQLIL